MEALLPVLNDLCVIFFDLLLFTRMISLKNDLLKTKLIMYIGCGSIIILYLTATHLLGYPGSAASAVCLTIPSLFLFLYLSEYKDSRFFLTFCCVDSFSLLVAAFGRSFGILFEKRAGIFSFLCTTAIFLSVFLIGKDYFKRYRNLLTVAKAGWKCMAISSAIIYFAVIFLSSYPIPLIQRTEYIPSYLVFSLVALSSYAVFINSIFKTKQICEQNIRLEREKEIYCIAYTDVLTGLYNRASYIETINILEQSPTSRDSLYCLMLDLNDFKAVNDTMGHHMGDEALKLVANLLREVFSEKTTYIYRIGGDEFAVLMTSVSAAFVRDCVFKLEDRVAHTARETGIPLSIAVGYERLSRREGDTIEDAFKRADEKMYMDKKEKKSGRQPFLS